MGFGQTFPIEKGTDVTLDPNSGYLRLGNTNGLNIVMDENEIQARLNGTTSSLTLNNEGGNVRMGGFTNLGLNAPAIKTKLIEGLETFQVINIPHGLTAANILSIDIISFGPVGDLFWRVKDVLRFDDTNITVDGGIPGDASYKVFITYRQ